MKNTKYIRLRVRLLQMFSFLSAGIVCLCLMSCTTYYNTPDASQDDMAHINVRIDLNFSKSENIPSYISITGVDGCPVENGNSEIWLLPGKHQLKLKVSANSGNRGLISSGYHKADLYVHAGQHLTIGGDISERSNNDNYYFLWRLRPTTLTDGGKQVGFNESDWTFQTYAKRLLINY